MGCPSNGIEYSFNFESRVDQTHQAQIHQHQFHGVLPTRSPRALARHERNPRRPQRRQGVWQ